jgi:hypothetical protein
VGQERNSNSGDTAVLGSHDDQRMVDCTVDLASTLKSSHASPGILRIKQVIIAVAVTMLFCCIGVLLYLHPQLNPGTVSTVTDVHSRADLEPVVHGLDNAPETSPKAIPLAEGDYVRRGSVEAVKWLRLAAAQNHSDAQYNLGLHLYTGNGVDEKDIHEAARLFKLAAEQGHAKAQYYLGLYYANGEDR